MSRQWEVGTTANRRWTGETHDRCCTCPPNTTEQGALINPCVLKVREESRPLVTARLPLNEEELLSNLAESTQCPAQAAR